MIKIIHKFLNIIFKNKIPNEIIKISGSYSIGKKICIFAHFDLNNKINISTIDYIKEIYDCGYEIIFVSTSEYLDQKYLKLIEPFTAIRVVKKNVGYDFISWKTGFSYISKPLDSTHIMLANDSVYRSKFSLKKMVDVMERAEFDLWGVTDNYEIAHHIQSYFLVFQNNAIKKGFINEYMSLIKVEHIKQEIINKYEVGLIKIARIEGYRIGAFCNYTALLEYLIDNKLIQDKNLFVNSTLKFPYELLNFFNTPFIKKELFRINPHNIKLDKIINHLKVYENEKK